MIAVLTAGGCCALAAIAGALLARWLRRHAYRYEDESQHPHRRHLWVPVALPVAAGALTLALASRWPVPVAVGCAVALVPLTALAAIDLDVHRLPDRLTYPLVPLALAIGAVSSATTGDWWALGRAALAGPVLLAAYFILLFASPGASGLGLGDVKLAAGLGILLGWFSWAAVLGGTLAAFIASGLWAAGLLITRRATRHSHIAFGPFMVLGAVLALIAS